MLKLLLTIVALAAMAPASAAQSYPRYRPMASPFVPLSSWVYSAIERLAALGYAPTAALGMKPWTRLECARLTQDAGEILRQQILEDQKPALLAPSFISDLKREFAFELEVLSGGSTNSLRLGNVYARVLSISGPPLTDGFHFGQTISYDFGRPNRRGTNAIAGFAARATSGRLAVFFSGEFQHAPSSPPPTDAALDLIALRDRTPRTPSTTLPSLNRARLLDTYATFNLANWQLTAGFQSLSWAPGPGGSMLLSTNAPPIPMVRWTRVMPFVFPGFLSRLGPVRTEIFLGRLRGRPNLPHTFIYGSKITIKPWPTFEFSFGRTTLLGGAAPLTLGNLIRSAVGIAAPNSDSIPGDTRNSAVWLWRLPGLGKRVTFYGELYADDEPIYVPSKASFRPGIKITGVPGLPRLDVAIEAASTESPGFSNHTGNLNYWNGEFTDGYTNEGFLLGNTVGRQGRTIHAWATYWLSSRQSFTFTFARSRVRPEFIPEGGSWQDYRLQHRVHLSSGLYLNHFIQFEHISRYPILNLHRRNNLSFSLELGFAPEGGRL